MKKFYLFAAAAVLLTACVKTQSLDEVAPINTDETAVSFDVYTPRATKAGKPQVITTEVLKAGPGFGVFAYYTDDTKYDQYVKPNFMYNQQVKWTSEPATGYWVYEPVKYWPNETGDAAKSDDCDYVSFFAYAPYVTCDPATGAVKRPDNAPDQVPSETELQQKNITGMTNNNTMGDPKIKYVVDWNPATSVDLLWGVQTTAENPDVDVIGMPFVDRTKPRTSKKLDFTMLHALSKLNVQIDAIVDKETAPSDNIEDETKIYVRSITFEGFAAKGTLNLKNVQKSTPLWIDYSGVDNLVAEPVTIFDGRKDGKEGHLDGEATREKVTGLNPVIIQSEPYGPTATKGVTNQVVNLFKPFSTEHGEKDPIFVIPNGDAMTVTIEYDVETIDENLAGYLSDGKTHGSSIRNTITKKIEVSGEALKMVAGKAYTINLHLGMTRIKVEAEVEAWDPTDPQNVDLPANV